MEFKPVKNTQQSINTDVDNILKNIVRKTMNLIHVLDLVFSIGYPNRYGGQAGFKIDYYDPETEHSYAYIVVRHPNEKIRSIDATIYKPNAPNRIIILFKNNKPKIYAEYPENIMDSLNIIMKAFENELRRIILFTLSTSHGIMYIHRKQIKWLTYIDDKALTTPAPAITTAITRTINNKTINNLKKINIKTLENNNIETVYTSVEIKYNCPPALCTQPSVVDARQRIKKRYFQEPYHEVISAIYKRYHDAPDEKIWIEHKLDPNNEVNTYYYSYSLTKTYETLYYKQNLDTAKTIIKEYKEIITPITETINTTITQHTTQYPIHLRIQPQRNRGENKIKGKARKTMHLKYLADTLDPAINSISITKNIKFSRPDNYHDYCQIKIEIHRKNGQVITRGEIELIPPIDLDEPNARITLYLSKHGHVSITGRITKENTKPETINLIKHAINDALKTAETILRTQQGGSK